MLISAVEYVLHVNKGGILSLNHGRLLHAAFLNLVREQDAALSAWLHDSNQKCFALDLLRRPSDRTRDFIDPGAWKKVSYRHGDMVVWRAAGLVTKVTELLLALPLHSTLKVGTLEFELIAKNSEQSDDNDCGVVTMEELAQGCAMLPDLTSVTFDFVSPTSFRSFASDYPFPRPELVFGSIADKWNEFSDTVLLDAKEIRRLAAEFVIPDQWQGGSMGLKITDSRAIKAFQGSFTYNLRQLDQEMVKVFILLAEYARFCGVGRLTGQGLGRVKISYK